MATGHKPRVFLDTNVIFSGLYSSSGTPAAILGHFLRGNISVVVSQQVLEELVRTIKEKLPESLPALRRLLVNSPPEIITDHHPDEIARFMGKLSIGDAAILAAAISAKPDYFVTGDNRFLKNRVLAEESGLRIVIPAQFLKITELE